MLKLYQKISFCFACLFIAYIPFQQLLSEFLTKEMVLSTPVAFWLSHWYEPFVLIFAAVGTFQMLRAEKLALWQKLLFLLLLFGGISVLFIASTIGRGLEGFRLSLFFILALFTLYSISIQYLKKISNFYLAIALLVAIWGIVERFLAPNYWMAVFGASPDFGYGSFLVGTIRRSCSFLNGPNQLGSYLLPAAFLILLWIFHTKSYFSKITGYIGFGLIVLAIGFSYSRAALIGLAVGLLIYALWGLKKWPERIMLGTVTALALAIPIFFAFHSGNSAITVITHDTSQIGHNLAVESSFSEIINRTDNLEVFLFGSGLSTAGPLAFKYGGLISESWYLQLALELGLVGALLWISFAFSLLFALWKKSLELALAFLAILIAALTLHTFADNPAISYTLFILIGASLSNLKHSEAP